MGAGALEDYLHDRTIAELLDLIRVQDFISRSAQEAVVNEIEQRVLKLMNDKKVE